MKTTTGRPFVPVGGGLSRAMIPEDVPAGRDLFIGRTPLSTGGPSCVSCHTTGDLRGFGGGTLGHPWGNAAGAAANRVALEACTEARNAGRDLEREGKEILTAAAKHSPELGAAMETWKEIKFEFDTVDKLAAS